MNESRDEDTVATNAIDQAIPIDEELPDSLVTKLGNWNSEFAAFSALAISVAA